MTMNTRAGTFLIIVAGLCALLASLTVAFLARMRSDAEEMQALVHETQARMMLTAACNYLQEASRIGWEPSNSTPTGDDNTETFGWIDVRDNKIGPKLIANGADDDSRFPIRSAKRFDMYLWTVPPYALQLTVSYNPILTTQTAPSVPVTDGRFGVPNLSYPDPQPVGEATNSFTLANPDGSTVNDANFSRWSAGEKNPRLNSLGMSWFRLYRESGATFVVTCGAGGTRGFRNWTEMSAVERAEFNNDPGFFAQMRLSETRLWYRVEWSAASLDNNYHMFDRATGDGYDHYLLYPVNPKHTDATSGARGHSHLRSFGGTIRWIQRLRNEPTHW
jgi:hypothetical protein